MSTSELDLERLAKLNKIPLNGVYSKDLLPLNVKPGGYIINLENHDQGNGTHWTALWIDPDLNPVYFDSMGFIFPRRIHIIKNIKKPIPYLNTDIQDIHDDHCGYYCLFFLWWMSHSKDILIKRFGKFISMFDKNEKNNLSLLKKYLRLI